MSEDASVVVGVDGSEPAREALLYALFEGKRRGATVRVVQVMPEPSREERSYAEVDPVSLALPALSVDELRAGPKREITASVEELRAEHPELAGVSVTMQVPIGHPARVLLEHARDADLLVVGHRGRGALAGALLGSVGLACVLHAPVPVTIVRPLGRSLRIPT